MGKCRNCGKETQGKRQLCEGCEREKRLVYLREYRIKKKESEKGFCISCGQPVNDGHQRCRYCREKIKIKRHNYSKGKRCQCGEPISNNATMCKKCRSERGYKRTEQGTVRICLDCGIELHDMRSQRCDACRKKHNEDLDRAYFEKNGMKRKREHCRVCGIELEPSKAALCEACRNKEAEMRKASRTKEKQKEEKIPRSFLKKYPTGWEAQVRWKEKKMAEALRKAREAGMHYGEAVDKGLI